MSSMLANLTELDALGVAPPLRSAALSMPA